MFSYCWQMHEHRVGKAMFNLPTLRDDCKPKGLFGRHKAQGNKTKWRMKTVCSTGRLVSKQSPRAQNADCGFGSALERREKMSRPLLSVLDSSLSPVFSSLSSPLEETLTSAWTEWFWGVVLAETGGGLENANLGGIPEPKWVPTCVSAQRI